MHLKINMLLRSSLLSCVVALFPRKLYVGCNRRVLHPKIIIFGCCLLCAPILDLTVFCVALRFFAFLCVTLRFFAFVCVLTCDRTHCNDLLMHRVWNYLCNIAERKNTRTNSFKAMHLISQEVRVEHKLHNINIWVQWKDAVRSHVHERRVTLGSGSCTEAHVCWPSCMYALGRFCWRRARWSALTRSNIDASHASCSLTQDLQGRNALTEFDELVKVDFSEGKTSIVLNQQTKLLLKNW